MRFTFLILLFFTCPLLGQNTVPFCFEQIKEANLWLYGTNPAGLAATSNISFSSAEGGYDLHNGGLRQIYEPEIKHEYRIGTESLRHLKKVSLYGQAGYAGEIGIRQQWGTLFYPSAHTILFSDSIPGQQKGETYQLAGGVAIPLNKQWTLGANAHREARNRAKDTDPRSQNKYINLRLSPGVTYQINNLRLGVSVAWQKTDEDIEYKSVGKEKKNGLIFYPLWFYIPESFSDGMRSSRYYKYQFYEGALQMGYKNRRWELFCEAVYGSGEEDIWINRSTRESAGESKNKQYRFFNRTVYRGEVFQHTFTPTFQRKELTGYDLQQQQQTVNQPVYETLHRIKRSELVTTTADFRYELKTKGYWKAYFNGTYERRNTQFRLYPTDFSQCISRYRCAIGYKRYFQYEKQRVDYGMELHYAAGDGDLIRITTPQNGSQPEINLKQNQDILVREHAFLTAQNSGLHLHLRYTHVLKKTSTIYGIIRSSYTQSFNNSTANTYALTTSLTAGITF